MTNEEQLQITLMMVNIAECIINKDRTKLSEIKARAREELLILYNQGVYARPKDSVIIIDKGKILNM